MIITEEQYLKAKEIVDIYNQQQDLKNKMLNDQFWQSSYKVIFPEQNNITRRIENAIDNWIFYIKNQEKGETWDTILMWKPNPYPITLYDIRELLPQQNLLKVRNMGKNSVNYFMKCYSEYLAKHNQA